MGGAMIYIPGIIKIGLAIQKLMGVEYRGLGDISLFTFFYQRKGSRQIIYIFLTKESKLTMKGGKPKT
jgi:hypothetical protein